MPATVVDLFSGAGGMSAGFAAHGGFEIVAAADAQIGKPSTGRGTLACNDTYEANLGVRPAAIDLGRVAPGDLGAALGLSERPTVLLACPPCTGFSRALARNHLVDDARNSLVGRVGEFVRELRPQAVVMENARELLMGRFRAHFEALRAALEAEGFAVHASTHFLSDFGLPQRRERALVVAVRGGLPGGLEALWDGAQVAPEAITVRRAIGNLRPLEAGEQDPADPAHRAPGITSPVARRRLAATPHDGGSWTDLIGHPHAEELLTPSMRRRVAQGELGSHPDVYGRLAWDRPAATIKRECAHVGNGRYAHPEQDRLCSLRELALLQGFPADYRFPGRSLANGYRHVGDAVPPLVSHQLAHLVHWALGGRRPDPEELALHGTSLRPQDVVPDAVPAAA